ncbi:MAG: hypothetical protein EB120_13445 [Proteobacteria bacterium]|nr:hypothetical protein [Pseudomonadota bacterium]
MSSGQRLISIVNYGLANLRSVQKAFEAVGVDAQICQDPQQLYQASHVVLPGVGAFEVAINNLKKGGWVEALNDNVLVQKKPLLGICLGLQLLANKSYENGVFEGLDTSRAKCVRYENFHLICRCQM